MAGNEGRGGPVTRPTVVRWDRSVGVDDSRDQVEGLVAEVTDDPDSMHKSCSFSPFYSPIRRVCASASRVLPLFPHPLLIHSVR